MKKTLTFFLLTSIIIMISSQMFAQGVGNHLTMSIENCSYSATDIIQFDLMVTSDGASNSDLRPNNFSCEIKYDSCILQSGAIIAATYVFGSTDSIFPPVNIAFPPSTFPHHIRMDESLCTNCNSNSHSMIIGHKYRIGTIQLTSTADYSNCCPDFSIPDSDVIAEIYIDNTCCNPVCCTYAFHVPGTGDMQVATNVICSICAIEIDENNGNTLIISLPNPSHNQIEINGNDIQSLTLYDVLGRVIWLSNSEINSPFQINTSSFSRGVYFLQAKTKGGMVVRKIVLQ